MTQSFSVRCQNCGAPLQIQEGLRYITCAHCGSELEIVRDDSTVHTAVIKAIAGELEAMRTKVKVLELQAEIDRLDREWEAWKQSNLGRWRDGSLIVPSPPMDLQSTAWLIFACFVMLAALMLANDASPSGWGMLAAGLLVACILAHAINRHAQIYSNSKTRYERERNGYIASLEAARRTETLRHLDS